MINPKDFLGKDNSLKNDDELVDIEGTFSCPENGCFETTIIGKFNERERIITWVCPNGHLGRATL